jgi:glutamyl-tRNA synthetase
MIAALNDSTRAPGPPPGVVGRLAPSPTGVLHLGNARTFLLTWLDARARGGRLLLRIEDIDGPRLRTGAEAATLEDLEWLGLDWDGAVLRQSEHLAFYRQMVDELIAKDLAYPCVCTRKEIEEAASAPHEDWFDSTPYPGTCRSRFESVSAAREESGRDPAIRFAVDVSAVPFVDRVVGAQDGRIRGDFVIQKRDGEAAYQCAVVVDDHRTAVTDVIRGDDLLPSTPRQLLLYRAFGWSPPHFAHLPLLVGPDDKRLAKRHGDTSLRAFRARGIDAPRMLGYLGMLAGLLQAAIPTSIDELLARYRELGGEIARLDCRRRIALGPQ